MPRYATLCAGLRVAHAEGDTTSRAWAASSFWETSVGRSYALSVFSGTICGVCGKVDGGSNLFRRAWLCFLRQESDPSLVWAVAIPV
eukprot:533683-Rhodomonas_salina.3